jgi:hypothetical protein
VRPAPIYSWEQALVYAEMHINRAVFEMNKKGYPLDSPMYKEKPDKQYILKELVKAQEELRSLIKKLKIKPEAA